MNKDWMLKIYRYDGSESILRSGLTEEEAREAAHDMNTKEQTDQYRAEKWDVEKFMWTIKADEEIIG